MPKARHNLAGASSPNQGIFAQLKTWRDQHRKNAWQSIQALGERPLTNLATILILTIAILLPNLLFLGLNNVQQWINHSDNGLEVSAYLHLDTNESHLADLEKAANSWPEVASTRYISPNEAISLIVHSSDMDSIVQSLPNNPLPPTLLIALNSNNLDDIQTNAELVASRLHQFSTVESVSYNASWFSKAQAFVKLGQQLSIALSVLLSIGVVLLVSNTVRTIIEQRCEEIVVAKLVGATDHYVRRPFLYFAAWLGLAAGIMAITMTYTCWLALTYLVAPLETAYSSNISVFSPPVTIVILSLIGAPLLSWIGAWLICNTQIRAIEPQ